MATANFVPMNYDMPMIVNRTYEQAEKLFNDGYFETEDQFDDEYYGMILEDDAEYSQEMAEEFNVGLSFYTVGVRSGYYTGFQFVVDEKYGKEFDLDDIDNDDAHYYFDACRSAVLRKAKSERRKIEKWLLSLVDGESFNRIVCTGRFHNGETTYAFA